MPISHQLVTLRQHLATCGYYPYKRKPTAAATDFIVDSSQRFGHTLAPKLALRHGPRQSISVNRAGKQVTLRRVPNQTASITASDIDDDKPERDGRASLLAFIAALDASARSLRRDGYGDHTTTREFWARV